jgi:N-methylhydantoinase A
VTFISCGIDIGGTFTDCVLLARDGGIYTGKAPTVPEHLAEGFFEALTVAATAAGTTDDAVLSGLAHLGHGSTVATNAMVQRVGARVGLLTTAGHGDATLIQRAAGRVAGLAPGQLLDLVVGVKPPPIVSRDRIREIHERVDVDGDIVLPLDEAAAVKEIEELLEADVDAVAICLLWSFRNPTHEQKLAALVAEKTANGPDKSGVFISVSHEVAPTWGEYERAMTTIINAFVGPKTGRYIEALASELEDRAFGGSFTIMKSDGGGAKPHDVSRFPVTLIASGPAGGLAATQQLSQRLGITNAIATDMGGTSFDVGLIIDGVPVAATRSTVNRYEFHLPTLDIRSVGSGGGSIAWIDEASGVLRVGPESAGSTPGPAAYGRGGTEATVTDADVVLGYVNPAYFLGGRLQLSAAHAVEAISRLSDRLGMSTLETAAGIRRIVDAQMSDAIRMLTIERGHDPRDFTLFSFGGAGPLHGADYARDLGVAMMIVPLADVSSVWSAFGIANADLVHIREHSEVLTEPFDEEHVRSALDALGTQVRELFEPEMRPAGRLEFTASFKYQLQAHVVPVPISDDDLGDLEGVIGRFEAMYRERYGEESGFRAAGIEIMGFTCKGVVARTRGDIRLGVTQSRYAEPTGQRPVYWSDLEGTRETAVFRGSDLGAGAAIAGPAIIELPDTTVAVPTDFVGRIDDLGSLVLNRVKA